MPTVRVVIPTFNRAALLCEAVQSVLAQTFRDFEVVVADDGSTDGTEEAMRGLEQQDSRIRYLKLPRGGVSAARNTAIGFPGAFRLMALLDSDDYWLPHHLERAVAALEQFPHTALVFARAQTTDVQGQWSAEQHERRERSMYRPLACSIEQVEAVHVLDKRQVRRALLRGDFNPHPSTCVIRADAVENPWFNAERTPFEDCELFVRIAARADFLFMNELHTHVRYHGDNLTGATEFGTDRSLRLFERHLAYAEWKLSECVDREDRAAVGAEVADASYFVGQCWAERRTLGRARQAYRRSLGARPSYKALRGALLCCLPKPVYSRLRILREGRVKDAQYVA